MPEIGEIARIVGRLNRHLVGRTIASVEAQSDTILFKDTTAEEFQTKLAGRTVQAAKQWGKYFWFVSLNSRRKLPLLTCLTQACDGQTTSSVDASGYVYPAALNPSPPGADSWKGIGMTGWIHFKDDPGSHYRASGKLKPSETVWPPRFHKFILKLQGSTNELAFVDARRLARIRLIHHPDGNQLRSLPPLKENGPDPVIEPVSLEWLQTQLKSRKVPIKAWLLDQKAIAGIGNWVGYVACRGVLVECADGRRQR